MSDRKDMLIDKILGVYGSEADIQRTATQLQPMITMMLQMADGKEEDAPKLSRQLSEMVTPVIREVAKEQYQHLLDEDKAVILASFYELNPWYHCMQARLNDAIHTASVERISPLMEKLFESYIPTA